MTCPYCKSENHPEATRCSACASWIASPVPAREWTRAHEGRQLAGVCRGLANRFGLPIAVARLLFLVSIFFGGWGVLLYVALWIAMPLEPQTAAGIAPSEPSRGLEATPPQRSEPAGAIVLANR